MEGRVDEIKQSRGKRPQGPTQDTDNEFAWTLKPIFYICHIRDATIVQHQRLTTVLALLKYSSTMPSQSVIFKRWRSGLHKGVNGAKQLRPAVSHFLHRRQFGSVTSSTARLGGTMLVKCCVCVFVCVQEMFCYNPFLVSRHSNVCVLNVGFEPEELA